MKFDDQIKSTSEIIEKCFSNLLEGKMKHYSSMDQGWEKILKNIPGNGEKIAAHSEIKEIKNGLLYIETDHSGWIQLIQLHKKQILFLLKKEFASLEIKDFYFTVKEKQ